MATARIALDALGGDHCPHNEVQGAVEAARAGVEILLVGDREAITAELAKYDDRDRLPIAIHHAPDRITMEDHPGKAVRAKPDASMPMAFELVRRGEAAAAMSAGNSGAMLACGLFKYRRIRGVDRPAIVTSLPNRSGFTTLLDVGANVECRPINLVQFAVLGAAYAAFRHGKARPRVGVLSNGSEDGKGTDLTRAVHQLLEAHPQGAFEYAGYAEGAGLFDGSFDVVVTDGFTGNVALKVAEATGRLIGGWLRAAVTSSITNKLGALILRGAFDELRGRMNPDTYGAAPLVGVDGLAFICHGGASPFAIATALRLAQRTIHEDVMGAMTTALTEAAPLCAAAREHGRDEAGKETTA